MTSVFLLQWNKANVVFSLGKKIFRSSSLFGFQIYFQHPLMCRSKILSYQIKSYERITFTQEIFVKKCPTWNSFRSIRTDRQKQIANSLSRILPYLHIPSVHRHTVSLRAPPELFGSLTQHCYLQRLRSW